MYLILKKDGPDRYVMARESTKTATELYNSTYFEYIHWVVDISGAAPAKDDSTPWTDSRGYSEKRRCAYEMELDRLTLSWKGCKDYDGDSETTALTGSATFTSGSASVSGSGTQFQSELAVGDYIQLDADADAYKVSAIASDTALTLEENYDSTGGAGASSKLLAPKGEAKKLRRDIKKKYPKP